MYAGGGSTSAFAASRPSSDDWIERLTLRSVRELPAPEARRLATTSVPLRRLQSRLLSSSDIEIRAAEHETPEGQTLLAVSVVGTERAAAWYRLVDDSGAPVHQRAHAFEVDERHDRLHVLDVHDDGRYSSPRRASESGTLGASCSSDSDCPGGGCYVCNCSSIDATCAFNCCAPCAFACGSLWGCLGCVLIFCPLCAAVSECCTAANCINACGDA